MSLPQDSDSLAEELRFVHLQCCVWLKVIEANLPPLNIECNRWKVRESYNGASMFFSRNKLPPSMKNSSGTD